MRPRERGRQSSTVLASEASRTCCPAEIRGHRCLGGAEAPAAAVSVPSEQSSECQEAGKNCVRAALRRLEQPGDSCAAARRACLLCEGGNQRCSRRIDHQASRLVADLEGFRRAAPRARRRGARAVRPPWVALPGSCAVPRSMRGAAPHYTAWVSRQREREARPRGRFCSGRATGLAGPSPGAVGVRRYSRSLARTGSQPRVTTSQKARPA